MRSIRNLITCFIILILFSNVLSASCSDYLSKSFSSPFHLLENYRGEDTIGITIAGFWPITRSRQSRVSYYDSEKRREFELTYRRGSYYLGGRIFNKFKRFFILRSLIYGVSPVDAKIYLTKPSTYSVHHSSFLEGGDMAAVGNFRPSYIDNFSGHYKPDFEGILAMIEAMLIGGFPLPKTIGVVIEYPTIVSFPRLAYINLPKAMHRWREGKIYRVSGISAESLEKLRILLSAYDCN